MRGRLIFPFLADIYRLDGEGMVAHNLYDPDFNEPISVDIHHDGLGVSARREQPVVQIPCQIEPKSLEELRMMPAGQSPRLRMTLVFHFRDLERLALVDKQTGAALIQPSDRLGGLYSKAGQLVQAFPNPPGLFVTETQTMGFGLNHHQPRRNLLSVRFEDRPVAFRSRT